MEAKVEDELGRGSQPPSRWDHENLAEVINLLQTLAMSGDLERPREFSLYNFAGKTSQWTHQIIIGVEQVL